jgi:putative salt-induced outer membrane protein YdiY
MGVATADEVIMRNGDRLSGDVVRQDNGQLQLETGYAGTISIDWQQVRAVYLDDPVPVLLDDEKVIRVARVVREQEQLQLTVPPPAEPIMLPPERVEIVDPEPWEMGDGYRLSGQINLGLENDRGNSDSQELDLDFNLNYRRRRHEWDSYGALAYSTTRDVETTENWTLVNKYTRHYRRRPWYGAARLRLKHDRFADLRLRYLVGPSLGYRFDTRDDIRLSAEIGPGYLHEDFYDQQDTDSWGPGLYLDYEQDLMADQLQLYLTAMGFRALSRQTNDLWVSRAGLRLPLVGGFVGSLEYEIDYDSNPAEDAKTTDTALRFKLGYQW